RLLDRIRSGEVPLRPVDDDRLARGDLPLDLRDDQPEPGGRQASGGRGRAVEDRPGGGHAERGAAPAVAADPRPDEGGSRDRGPMGGGGPAAARLAGWWAGATWPSPRRRARPRARAASRPRL